MRASHVAVLVTLAVSAVAQAVGSSDGGAGAGGTPPASSDGGSRPDPHAGHASLTDAGTKGRPDAGAAQLRPLLVIAEDASVLERYPELKPAARAQQKTTTQLRIGTSYTLGVFADGYTLPFSRVVDLSADLTITDSTGRVVLERASLAHARTMDPLKHLATHLTPDLPLFYGLTDPEGTYTAHLSVFDHVRGSVTRADFAFQVKR